MILIDLHYTPINWNKTDESIKHLGLHMHSKLTLINTKLTQDHSEDSWHAPAQSVQYKQPVISSPLSYSECTLVRPQLTDTQLGVPDMADFLRTLATTFKDNMSSLSETSRFELGRATHNYNRRLKARLLQDVM